MKEEFWLIIVLLVVGGMYYSVRTELNLVQTVQPQLETSDQLITDQYRQIIEESAHRDEDYKRVVSQLLENEQFHFPQDNSEIIHIPSGDTPDEVFHDEDHHYLISQIEKEEATEILNWENR